MAKPVLSLSLLCLALCVADFGNANPSATDFIRSSCKVTRYPELCVQCLSGYADAINMNEQRLALTALLVSLARAKSAANFVTKLTKVRGIQPREYRAVTGCIDNIGDSIDRLNQSIKELGHLGSGRDFRWHVSNAQTWVSAALTEQSTCLDGFAGRAMDGNVKSAVTRRVNNVAQVISNALALVNRFASRHRRTVSGEQP